MIGLAMDTNVKAPLTKCVTDMTEIKGCDGKLYVSAIFDCFDSSVTEKRYRNMAYNKV